MELESGNSSPRISMKPKRTTCQMSASPLATPSIVFWSVSWEKEQAPPLQKISWTLTSLIWSVLWALCNSNKMPRHTRSLLPMKKLRLIKPNHFTIHCTRPMVRMLKSLLLKKKRWKVVSLGTWTPLSSTESRSQFRIWQVCPSLSLPNFSHNQLNPISWALRLRRST